SVLFRRARLPRSTLFPYTTLFRSPGHAMWLAQRENGVAVLVGNGLTVELVGCAGVELEVAGEGDGIGARLRDRLAGVSRLEVRQYFLVSQHEVGPAAQQPATLHGARAPPDPGSGLAGIAVEGESGGLDRQVDVTGVAACDLCERAAVGGVDDRQRFAARCRHR